MFETLVAVGLWGAAAVGGVSLASVAVHWVRYSRSTWAKMTGNSFLKHCFKKYFQRSKQNRSGYAGEYETARQLEKVKGEKKILFDLLVPRGPDKTSEIDILMIHETGIYVFENKNYSGTVGAFSEGKGKKQRLCNVSANADRWAVLYGDNKLHSMINPVRQNESHVQVIRRLLSGFNIGTQRFFSFIVFNDSARVKGAPADFHTSVPVHLGMAKTLASDLNRRISQYGKILTPDKIEMIGAFFEPYVRVAEKEKAAHVERVSQFKSENTLLKEGEPVIHSFQPLNEIIKSADEHKSARQGMDEHIKKRMDGYLDVIRRS